MVPAPPGAPRPRVRVAVPLLLLALGGGLTLPGAAAAKTATGTVTVNAGYTLVARATPKNDGAVVRQLQNGAKVTILCQTEGQKTTGRFGTSKIWDKLEGGGYVSDTYVYTGSDGRVASDCPASEPEPATPAPAPETPVTSPAAPSTAAPTGGAGGSTKGAKVTLKDDYPHRNASWHDVDPWRFYFRECTSFVAYRLSRNIKKFKNDWGGHGVFGNAIDWDDKARRLGYVVDTTPAKGSVMVRNYRNNGHVAVVAKVGTGDRKGQFYVEQYNADGGHGYSKEWKTNGKGLLFIHFERPKR